MLYLLLRRRRIQREQQRKLQILLALCRISASIRTRNRLVRRSLGDANQSSWHNLYHDDHDGSFICATSLNRESFEVLLEEFSKHYVVRSGPGKKGRPRKMTEKSTVLGLLLVFYTGTADAVGLCMQFNIPPTTLLRTISNAEIALEKTLKNISDAHIRWPTKSEQRTWAGAIEAKEPLVRNKFGFIDGKNYPVQEPSIVDRQNALYNGWLHSVLITGVLCFGADGCIIWMKHNCPGSWNDGQMSRQFREKLLDEKKTLQDYGVTADSAFPSNATMFNRIVTPLKEGDLERAPAATRSALSRMSAAITSIRQAAEWGMGAVEKVYTSDCRITRPDEPSCSSISTAYTISECGALEFRKSEQLFLVNSVLF
ncbi:hypothetical protein CcCBS67573_g00088 [Chytriomyces confervae]|uniref:DDE Tnp4 domain-containing protein n=1 Tax=Chytriomyces confervae TaxID=246404 RepID=A0A507FQK3_9FUNG|nr:hypothetical protein CcCBS67573_g00088 [Chytriomyces confervae]